MAKPWHVFPSDWHDFDLPGTTKGKLVATSRELTNPYPRKL